MPWLWCRNRNEVHCVDSAGVFFCLAHAQQWQEQAAEQVTLLTPEIAIEYALEANLAYLNLIDRTEIAELDFASARSVYKHKFRLYTSSDARSGAEVGTIASFSVSRRNESGSGYSAEIYNSSFGDRTLSEFRLAYALPFFRNPLDSAKQGIQQAEMNLSRRKRLQEIGTQELINEVISSYLELILRNHMEDLVASEYEIARNRYREQQIRARGGEISSLDLEQFALRVAQAERNLELARFNRRSQENGFKVLLGIDLDQEIRIDTHIPRSRYAHLLEIPLPELEEHAWRSRTELIGKLEEIELVERRIEAGSGSSFPPAEVTLQYAYVEESGIPGLLPSDEDHRFGIGIHMDTDFGISAKAREQRKNYLTLRTLERDFVQLRMDIRMEVRRAYFQARQSRDLLDLRTREREINERIYDQVGIQYANGQTDALRLLETEQQLQKSRYDELSARIAFLQAGQALAMASAHD